MKNSQCTTSSISMDEDIGKLPFSFNIGKIVKDKIGDLIDCFKGELPLNRGKLKKCLKGDLPLNKLKRVEAFKQKYGKEGIEFIELLVNHFNDINKNLLDFVEKYNENENGLIKYLFQRDKKTNSFFHLFDFIECILRKNNVNATGFIHYLSQNDDYSELLSAFIKIKGVDVNIFNIYNQTPLMIAVRNNSLVNLSILLSHNEIDVNKQDDFGESAIFKTLKFFNAKTAYTILSHPDYDENIKNISGNTFNSELNFLIGYSQTIIQKYNTLNNTMLMKQPNSQSGNRIIDTVYQ